MLIENVRNIFPNQSIFVVLKETEVLPISLIQHGEISGAIYSHEISETLLHKVRAIASGATIFSCGILNRLLPTADESTFLFFGNISLSVRETEVMQLIIKGYDNQQISLTLQLGRQTVRNYVCRLYEKFGVQNRAQLLVKLHNEVHDH